jgi:hypothetical protein
MYFVKRIAIYAWGKTTSETPTAYMFISFFPFSRLIFKAVIFNILGVIEPTKEKKKPKKKRENTVIRKKFYNGKDSFLKQVVQKNASNKLMRLLDLNLLINFYTTPWANIASATLTKPAIFAPLI